jgi:hypothetical protein
MLTIAKSAYRTLVTLFRMGTLIASEYSTMRAHNQR